MESVTWTAADRNRLVRLCATITGTPSAAEDLAQETLLEAWRNSAKLHDPTGRDKWLNAIARNICRRWAKRTAIERTRLTDDAPMDIGYDVDVTSELERAEMVDLVDRALATLPATTRDILVQRYVDGAPHAEIARRTGLSVDAVSMRITRGKLVMRRIFETDLRRDAEAFGLMQRSSSTWVPTSVWCADCGSARLLMGGGPGGDLLLFRCAACAPEPSLVSASYRLSNPTFAEVFGKVVRPTALLNRAADWAHDYFADGIRVGAVICTGCGSRVPLQPLPAAQPGRKEAAAGHGVYAECPHCAETVSSSLRGLTQSLPAVRGWRRDHPRSRALPVREIEAAGRAAFVVGYRDVLSNASVSAVLDRRTCRAIDVHVSPRG